MQEQAKEPQNTKTKPPQNTPATPAGNGKTPAAAGAASATEFDPLTFKNKAGKVNVNPNLKKKLQDGNPNKLKCTRCGYTHNFDQSLCTSERTMSGEACDPISQEEQNKRIHTRWNTGMFFSQVPDFLKSKSEPTTPQSSAAAV
jgi:hypothetical protein